MFKVISLKCHCCCCHHRERLPGMPAVEETGFSSFLRLSRTLFFLSYYLETSSVEKNPGNESLV